MLDKQMPPWRHMKPYKKKATGQVNERDKSAGAMARISGKEVPSFLGVQLLIMLIHVSNMPLQIPGDLTCCIIWGNSEQRVFLPLSSKIFSRVMSCSAINVVSNMSSPAWLANVKTGAACKQEGIATQMRGEKAMEK